MRVRSLGFRGLILTRVLGGLNGMMSGEILQHPIFLAVQKLQHFGDPDACKKFLFLQHSMACSFNLGRSWMMLKNRNKGCNAVQEFLHLRPRMMHFKGQSTLT